MDTKKLIMSIEAMNKDHHIEIYKIIKSYNIEITENNNGVFINMKNINEECLEKIYSYVKFINENKQDIIDYEKKKEENKLKLLSDNT